MAKQPKNLAVALRPNQFQVNQRGQFNQLKVGAGSMITFEANSEGCFSGAANYTLAPLKWNNLGYFYATTGEIAGDFTVTGSLFSDDGATFQTKLTLGKVSFLKAGVEKAYIKTASDSASLQCATGSYFYVTMLNGTPIAWIDQNANLILNNNGAYLHFATGGQITDDNGGLKITGSILPAANADKSLGSTDYRWKDIWAKTVVAWGTGAKFSCQGNDGVDDDDIYVASTSGGSPTKRLKVKGGIIYSSS